VFRATFDSRGAIFTGYFAREIGTEAGLVLKGGRACSEMTNDKAQMPNERSKVKNKNDKSKCKTWTSPIPQTMTSDKAQMPNQAQNLNGKSRGRGQENHPHPSINEGRGNDKGKTVRLLRWDLTILLNGV
jgi:hypothetical protein